MTSQPGSQSADLSDIIAGQEKIFVERQPESARMAGRARGSLAGGGTSSWQITDQLSIPAIGALTLGVAIVIFGALQLFLSRTQPGRQMRATAQDPDTDRISRPVLQSGHKQCLASGLSDLATRRLRGGFAAIPLSAQPGQQRRARESPFAADRAAWQFASLCGGQELRLVYSKQSRRFSAGQDLWRVLAYRDAADDEALVAQVLTHGVIDELTLGLAGRGHGLIQATRLGGRQAHVQGRVGL